MMVMVTAANHPGSGFFIEAAWTRNIEKTTESLLFCTCQLIFLIWLYGSPARFCSRNGNGNTASAKRLIHHGFRLVEVLGVWFSSAEFEGTIHDESPVFIVREIIAHARAILGLGTSLVTNEFSENFFHLLAPRVCVHEISDFVLGFLQ